MRQKCRDNFNYLLGLLINNYKFIHLQYSQNALQTSQLNEGHKSKEHRTIKSIIKIGSILIGSKNNLHVYVKIYGGICGI